MAASVATTALNRVEVEGVGKRYGLERALAKVSCTFEAGRVCALLGHNGAGKSTLLGMLSTLVAPSAGTIRYCSGDRELPRTAELRRRIGLLAHASLCYGELSARENLRLTADLYNVPADGAAIEQALDGVGLVTSARGRAAKTYSRGMMQRLSLARALLPRPTLVLLDEPFTGLDRGGAMALGQTIGGLKAQGAICVVITHDLEALGGIADQVLVLRRGLLVHQAQRAPEHGFSYSELAAMYQEHSD